MILYQLNLWFKMSVNIPNCANLKAQLNSLYPYSTFPAHPAVHPSCTCSKNLIYTESTSWWVRKILTVSPSILLLGDGERAGSGDEGFGIAPCFDSVDDSLSLFWHKSSLSREPGEASHASPSPSRQCPFTYSWFLFFTVASVSTITESVTVRLTPEEIQG